MNEGIPAFKIKIAFFPVGSRTVLRAEKTFFWYTEQSCIHLKISIFILQPDNHKRAFRYAGENECMRFFIRCKMCILMVEAFCIFVILFICIPETVIFKFPSAKTEKGIISKSSRNNFLIIVSCYYSLQ